MRACPDLWGEGLGNDPSYPAWRQRAALGGLASRQAETRSERRAGLETGNVGADPPLIRGRPMAVREASDRRTGSFPPGYWRRHVCKMDDVATREALSVVCTHQPEIREDQSGPSGWRTGL